ncbi:heterokaryon incompatibility protein-domain-containing protein [Nemania sp. FL0916]|nr:heterokaryon incompatibility protein-domain-containing protein [Nemania sp. FL0916]
MADDCDFCINLGSQLVHRQKEHEGPPATPALYQSDQIRLSDVELSSGRGCATCKFVMQVVKHFELQFEEDDFFSVAIFESEHVLLMFYGNITVQVYTPEGQLAAWEGLAQCPELSDYPHSNRAYQFIRSSLDRCLRSHPKCAQLGNYFPSRLIDVGSSHDSFVRVIETSPEFRGRYITLSYCWGDGKAVKTMQSNYEEMKAGIPIANLPRTIQDAIQATRELGQSHLWVDALCIIQDSKQDWEIESANMASIYQSSLLTLVAATAGAVGDGFLHQEHSTRMAKAAYQEVWQTTYGHKTILAARIVPGYYTHMGDYAEDDDVLPLSLRGWALQEWKLSTRGIIFRREELWWSCISQISCECSILQNMPETRRKFIYNSTHSVTTAEDNYREWHNTVELYTLRTIKYPSDKLPALAGIARVVQDRTGSTYIAGLWNDNLYEDLTWGVPIDTHSRMARSLAYYGPTFSWVSVNAYVNYRLEGNFVKTAYCDILAAKVSVSGLNPLGHVKSAYLTISAPLLKSALLLQIDDLTQFPKRNYSVTCGVEELLLSEDMALESFERVNEDGVIERSARRSNVPNSLAESGTEVWLLYIGYRTYTITTWDGTEHRHMYRIYLVLGKSPSDMSKYERIGIVREDCVIGENLSATPRWCDGFRINVLTII